MLTVAIYTIIAILGLFIAAGAVMLITSLVRGRKGTGLPPGAGGGSRQSPADRPSDGDPPGVRGALHRYVGPVEPRHALLNPPARVAVEFVAALFGFPGLGWLVSGKVVTGLVMLVVGPSIVWGAFPAYLIVTERIVGNPYLTIQYLPVLAVVTSVSLAVFHLRQTRATRKGRLEPEG